MLKNFITQQKYVFCKSSSYLTFLTIDNNLISGLVYKSHNNLFREENIVCTATNQLKGIKQNTIYSNTEFIHSIATCLDNLETQSNFRIKKIILCLIGFNSKSLLYSLNFQDIRNINLNNLLNYINPKEIVYYLGNDYILTNLLPVNLDQNHNKIIKLLMAGFKRSYIFEIIDIFYNLSIDIENILFAPLLLPYVFNENNDHYSPPIVVISSDYTLIHSNDVTQFIGFGTNYIFQQMSIMTHIPYDTLIKEFNYSIQQILLVRSQSLLYRVDDYIIKNIQQVINSSLESYANELNNLITSKNLHKHDKIILINNNLKLFKEQNLLTQLDKLNIIFSNIKVDTKFANFDINIAELLNKAAVSYYFRNFSIDLALKNFTKRINKIKEYYRQ